jgi:hypothetical protein
MRGRFEVLCLTGEPESGAFGSALAPFGEIGSALLDDGTAARTGVSGTGGDVSTTGPDEGVSGARGADAGAPAPRPTGIGAEDEASRAAGSADALTGVTGTKGGSRHCVSPTAPVPIKAPESIVVRIFLS